MTLVAVSTVPDVESDDSSKGFQSGRMSPLLSFRILNTPPYATGYGMRMQGLLHMPAKTFPDSWLKSSDFELFSILRLIDINVFLNANPEGR